jgi:hypothetical protein
MFLRKVPMPAAMKSSPGDAVRFLVKGMPEGSLTRQIGLMVRCHPQSKFEFTDAPMGVNAFFGLMHYGPAA